MIYKTSLDNVAKAITSGVTIIFAAIILAPCFLSIDEGKGASILTAVFLLLVYGLVYALRPINYELTPDSLIIQRLFMNVKIERNQIIKVVLLEKGNTKWAFRIFGVGGLFGYFGKFENSTLGSMTWYATRQDRTVLVETVDGKKIIITPDEAEKFVADFNG